MKLIFWLGACLCLICGGAIFYSLAPTPSQLIDIPFRTPSGETGLIILEYPLWVKAGDKFNISTQITTSDATNSNVSLINSRVDTNIEEFSPRGDVRVGIRSSVPFSLVWTLRPSLARSYKATLWLFLESDAGTELLLGREINLESRLVLGITPSILRVLSGFGSFIGILLMISVLRVLKLSRNSGRYDKIWKI